MNIKSLLLGSAAALAVVSGAQAADAIVAAEPEPAEYVKVCDAFGSGYFYIPGTETCLKIGGYVRQDFAGGKYNGGSTWARTRFQLSVSSASDTEYGALKSSATIRFNNTNGNDTMDVNEAIISLGGLTIGQTDSLFTTMTGYAGNVINDGDKVGYGPFDTQMIKYTLDAGNGLSVAVALEHDPATDEDGKSVQDDDYMPNLVGGLAYSSDTFGASAVVGYDEDSKSAAFKVRGDVTMGAVSAFAMAGFKSDVHAEIANKYAPWGGEWALWAGASFKASDKVSIDTQVSIDEAKDREFAIGATFKPVDGFKVTPEINYVKAGDGDGNWGGIIRFQRSF